MKINESKIRQIIREESRSLMSEAENPHYFSDEYENQDEDPNFFDDGSDDESMLDDHDEDIDYATMDALTAAYDDLINDGYTKQEILDFIIKHL